MKRFFLIAAAASALLVPTLAAAQGGTMVYRPELRGYVWVPTTQVPAVPVAKKAPTPAEIIARHEAMAIGLRANPNPRGGAVTAAVHCDRLIAEARETIRRNN
jgi:hypothetical protein